MSSLAGCILLFSSLVVGQNVGLPLGVPPGLNDAALQRIAPKKCIVYLGWSGTKSPQSSSANPSERLLAEPEVQKLIQRVNQFTTGQFQAIAGGLGPDGKHLARVIRTWMGHVLYRPGALYIDQVIAGQPPEAHGVLMVNMGKESAKLKTELAKVVQLPSVAGSIRKVTVVGNQLYRLNTPGNVPPDFTFGFVGSYFVFGIQPGNAKSAITRMMDRTATAPKWLQQLHKQLDVPRRSVVLHIDLAHIIKAMSTGATRQVDIIGFGNLGPLSVVSGFDKDGIITRALLGINGKAKGILQFLEAKPLTRNDLKNIPADSTMAIVARFDFGKYFTNLIATAAEIVPHGEEQLKALFAPLEAALGIDFRRELFANMGDVWAIYHSKSAGGWAGATVLIPVKNRDKITALEQKLLERLRSASEREDSFKLTTTTHKEQKIHHMSIRSLPIAPCWTLLKDRIAIGLFPQNLRDVIDRKATAKTLADVIPASTLKSQPLLIARHNTKELFEVAYPLIQLGIVVLFGNSSDPFLLPAGTSISRHLTKGQCVLSRTKDGLELTSRGVLPINFTSLIPLSLGPFLARDSVVEFRLDAK